MRGRDPGERQDGQAVSFRFTGRVELDWGLGPAGRGLRNSSLLSSGAEGGGGASGAAEAGRGRESAAGRLLPRHTRCGRKRNNRAQLPLAPAQRSAMAAEDVDGLAVSWPHYGCKYRDPGVRESARPPSDAQFEPSVLSSVQRCEGRLGHRRHGGSRGLRSPGLPRGHGVPAGSPGGPRRAAPPARWAPCRAGPRPSSTVLLRVGDQCWEKAVDEQQRGVPRLCGRRLPRASPPPRPRCPPRAGRGRPCLPPSRRFWRPHPIFWAKHRSHLTPSLACRGLAMEREALDLSVRRAGSPKLRYRVENDQRRRKTWCCGGAML